jgi:hypothetical protein
MRNIEKGLLLAETFKVDTSMYVPSFIEWIKNTEVYQEFLETEAILKKKRSFASVKMLKQYRKINVDRITSIKQGTILYGKIAYLVSLTKEENYVNPLLVENLDNKKMTIGDLKVNFDNKNITFRELSLNQNFLLETKQETLNKKIECWSNELHLRVIKPLMTYYKRKEYLPNVKAFNFLRVLEIIILLILTIGVGFIFGGYFFNLEITNAIFSKKMSLICFSCFGVCTLISDFICLFFSVKKAKYYHYYNLSKKVTFKDALAIEQKSINNLSDYINGELMKSGSMDKSVEEFSLFHHYYSYIEFVRKTIIDKDEIKQNHLALIEGFFLILVLIMLILSIFSYFF